MPRPDAYRFPMDTAELRETIDGFARDNDFSGVVSIRVAEEMAFEAAYGLADREHQRLNTPNTRFGLASGSKAFTALTVMRLVEDHRLDLSTTARHCSAQISHSSIRR